MSNIEQKITSMEVAEMVEKNHADLMRDIRRYVTQLGESKIAFTDFFQESTYQSEQNKTLPCYLVSKKGCDFIAHKMTGVKGSAFTARYINRFEEMEQQISKPVLSLDLLKIATLEVEQKVEAVDKDLQEFKHDLPLLAVEIELITHAVHKKGVACLGGKESAAYNDRPLRTKVYTDIHREIKRQFGVDTYKAIKRSQCHLAISIVESYELPLALRNEVENANAQMRLEAT